MKKIYQFNAGLIRQLKEMLISKLKTEKENLIKIQQNEVRIDDTIDGILKGIHIVLNNLKMAKLSEWEFLEKLENVVFLMKQRKAHPDSLNVSIESLGAFIEYLESKIDKLSRTGESDFYPMELWDHWSKLKNILEEKAKPNDLFYPFAEFTEEEVATFGPIEKEELKAKTNIAYQDYIDSANEWLNSQSSIDEVHNAKVALRKMYNVVNFFGKLKHKVSYQGYFIALEARLLMAFNHENAELDKRKNLELVIRTSIQELQGFRNDEKAPLFVNLKHTLDKFLIQKNYQHIKDEPIIKEVVERFNIEKFLSKATAVVNVEEKIRREEFKKHYSNLNKMIDAFIASFDYLREYYYDNQEDGYVYLAKNNKNLVQIQPILNNLVKYQPVFHSSVGDVFEAFRKLNESLSKDNKISFLEIEEYSGLFFVLKRYVDNKEDVRKDFIELFKKQAIRAEKSITQERKFLMTNKLDWTVLGQEIQKENFRKIYKNMKNLISQIKNDFYDLCDNGNKLKAEDVVIKTSQALAIMVMSKFNKTAQLVNYLRDIIIEKIKTDKYAFNNIERENAIKLLQNIEVFAEALEKGDEHPEKFVKDIYFEIFGIEDVKTFERKVNYVAKNENIDEILSKQKVEKQQINATYLDNQQMVDEVSERVKEDETHDAYHVEQDQNIDAEEDNSVYIPEDAKRNVTKEIDEDQDADVVEEIIDLSEDKLEMTNYFIDQFVEDLNEVYQNNITKLKNHDLPIDEYERVKIEIKRVSHTLKGDSRQLGYYKLGSIYEMSEFLIKDRLNDGFYLPKEFVDGYDEFYSFITNYLVEITEAIMQKKQSVTLRIEKAKIKAWRDKLFNIIEEDYAKQQIAYEQERVQNQFEEPMFDNLHLLNNQDQNVEKNITQETMNFASEENEENDNPFIQQNENIEILENQAQEQIQSQDQDVHEIINSSEEFVPDNHINEENDINENHEQDIAQEKSDDVNYIEDENLWKNEELNDVQAQEEEENFFGNDIKDINDIDEENLDIEIIEEEIDEQENNLENISFEDEYNKETGNVEDVLVENLTALNSVSLSLANMEDLKPNEQIANSLLVISKELLKIRKILLNEK